VVDVNLGCGIVRRGSQELFKKVPKKELTFKFFRKNKNKILNLCSIRTFCKREKNTKGNSKS